jgi:carbon monoxide dehydrogenase subunit G
MVENYSITKLPNYQIANYSITQSRMKIEGNQHISAPRQRVFAALVDPAVLQKCIPGCEHLEKTEENKYRAKLSAGVGPIKGVFTATVSLENIKAPEHYKLVVEGKGQPGFVKGTGELNLRETEGGTSIQYTGEVNVGGLLASVGQRMIQSAANMLAGKFFACLEGETLESPTSP